ncbi:MAG: hypothetical protein GY711_33425 [bacterium]|nr:hypothetical protein [bacterium]
MTTKTGTGTLTLYSRSRSGDANAQDRLFEKIAHNVEVYAFSLGRVGAMSALVRDETVTELWRRVAGLPENYRRLIEWRYVDGLGNKRIAERQELNPNTLRSQVMRAHHELRGLLEDLLPVRADAERCPTTD